MKSCSPLPHWKYGREKSNRHVPMGTNSAGPDGRISLEEIDYYEERAKGGAGMIILGAQFLTEDLAQGVLEGIVEKDYVVPMLTDLVDAVQRYGTRIIAQLSCGTGRNALPDRSGKPRYPPRPSLRSITRRFYVIHSPWRKFRRSWINLPIRLPG